MQKKIKEKLDFESIMQIQEDQINEDVDTNSIIKNEMTSEFICNYDSF